MSLNDNNLAVISDALLADLLKEQAPPHIGDYNDSGDDDDNDKLHSGATHADITSLRIEHKGVLKIANLETFSQLTQLQLDNNVIERIDNLHTLVHLTWLDLSYNNIETIEGLDTLVNLTDLSLQHNKIARLTGLESLHKLDVLSLGDNDLEGLVFITQYFRGLPCTLRSLSLAGNPVANDCEYAERIVAFIDTLRYLDWKPISDDVRLAGQQKYVNELDTAKLLEGEERERRAIKDEAAATLARHADALVPGMHGNVLWFELHATTPELNEIVQIPGLTVELERFRRVVEEQARVVGRRGIDVHDRQVEEHRLVIEALDEMTALVAAECAIETRMLTQRKDEFVHGAHADAGGPSVALAVEELYDLMDTQKDAHLSRELTLQHQAETIIGTFGRNLTELNLGIIELINESFSLIRKAEEEFYEKLSSRACRFFEGYARGVAEEGFEVSDGLHTIMRDKETISAICTSAHDRQVLAIDTKDDTLIKLMNNHVAELVDGLREAERKRNRSRVVEIMNNANFFRDDLESFAANISSHAS